MKRKQTWAEDLVDHFEAHRATRFAWGTADCGTFACGAVEAMTGEAIEVPLASSAEAYARMLRAYGSLASLVTARLGEPKPAAFAQRGDVVLVSIDGRDALAVCAGSEAATLGPEGLAMLPMTAATAAWSV